MKPKTEPVPAELVAPENTDRNTEFLRHQWRPGQSGNWTGRPRSRLEFLARERTLDGAALVEFWIRIFEGKEPGSGGAKGLRWRAWASQRLAERGWGKPNITVETVAERRAVSIDAKIFAGLDPDTARAALPLLRRLAEHMGKAAPE
jgi:hypothetical protein